MKNFVLVFGAFLLSCYSCAAENNILVEHTSANHTKIVIHNTSPEAYRERNERAREAGRRLELKRQRRHELELARIEDEERQARNRQAQARSQAQQPTIYRKKPHQPAAFMNGGQPTMGIGGGFSSVGYGGFGGYTPRPYAYRGGRCGTRSVRSRGYRGNRCRTTSRVSRPAGRAYRGRRCR